ncbi:MAG: NAD(+)/NADH kinase [Acidimicrobiales bacterium]
MARIGFAPHAERSLAVDIAKETAGWLEERGHVAVLLPEVGPRLARPEGVDELDLLVSLGGDGTMLRSVGMVIGTGIPVLGVNFGRFGYLTAAEPEGLRGAIERFLAGDWQPEHRMTVDAFVVPEGSRSPRYRATGLNDVVVARPAGMHTINTSVAISGKRFLSYAADSMIVSTPTGSTGYNLSARGPIVSPTLRCLVLTPVSPHMLFDRSIVLDSGEEVSFRLGGRCGADLIVDGAGCGQVELGEELVCRAGQHDAVFVSFGERDFDTALKNKFRLADR